MFTNNNIILGLNICDMAVLTKYTVTHISCIFCVGFMYYSPRKQIIFEKTLINKSLKSLGGLNITDVRCKYTFATLKILIIEYVIIRNK